MDIVLSPRYTTESKLYLWSNSPSSVTMDQSNTGNSVSWDERIEIGCPGSETAIQYRRRCQVYNIQNGSVAYILELSWKNNIYSDSEKYWSNRGNPQPCTRHTTSSEDTSNWAGKQPSIHFKTKKVVVQLRCWQEQRHSNSEHVRLAPVFTQVTTAFELLCSSTWSVLLT